MATLTIARMIKVTALSRHEFLWSSAAYTAIISITRRPIRAPEKTRKYRLYRTLSIYEISSMVTLIDDASFSIV